ncbi:unnamed protein product [Ranitomeya imitator]|uniref:Myotubularin phosphatase domain-containing protein n=1 Tax=Ranitomeya imitator TaxID=111125 RepID=A0ABN9MQE8_9NEOB|nr:unnamed protein product [Ranitomeya imitator]
MVERSEYDRVYGQVSFIQGEEPPSLEYIQAKDLFPPRELVKEENKLQVPFQVLPGESVEYLGSANDAVIAVSNYRLHIKFKDSVINVPLRMIETVESRDMFQLQIICKDSKVVRCHFSTFKQCQEWLKRLSRASARPTKQEDLFAFAYHAWCQGICTDDEDHHIHLCRPGDHVKDRFQMELLRMGFDMQNAWRVSDINHNYKLCASYPQKLLVPVWITDKELENVSSFRSWKRIPVVVYRHTRTGAVIARCSQPEISWWGWRNADDEYLVTSIAKACALNPGGRAATANFSKSSNDGNENGDTDFDSSLTACPGIEGSGAPQKLLILDARSYTAAVANRAKGGGCECEGFQTEECKELSDKLSNSQGPPVELQKYLELAGTITSNKTINNAINHHGLYACSPRKGTFTLSNFRTITIAIRDVAASWIAISLCLTRSSDEDPSVTSLVGAESLELYFVAGSPADIAESACVTPIQRCVHL